MNKLELLEYLEKNSTAVITFKSKALDYQNMKNQKRQPAKRWNAAKIERAVDKMLDQFIDSIFNKLKSAIKEDKYNPRDSWIKFMDANNILGDLEESVIEMEFE
ncbi:putative transposase [Latilactobacillus phage TMW 1.1447 P1]|uniref:hypothetical protein n=1 Tax=Latilactobacillus curvatus TaxID=28038 RepID=UPI00241009C2|nr:hypothetical protein [Latilactobacillus curvatus]MDG2982579.1 hypothetical protein [Latilactobacillus curvatus]WEU69738.1 putative transposase [Latilactobacillus phage TMW 1.1447 P1]